MSYKVITIPPFDKQFKKLAKRFPSIGMDLKALALALIENPFQGINLGNNCFKIRMQIKSKGK